MRDTPTIDATVNGRPIVGVHYQLHSYVCGTGCVKPSPFDGWVTFSLIFTNRPDKCRYAVAKIVPVFGYEPQGPWLCWDLYDDDLIKGDHPHDGLLPAPYPKWQGDSADGLIMKAIALYDRDM